MQLYSVHIYQTNIQFPRDKEFIVNQLNRVPSVRKATIDITDSDKVLRVECKSLSSSHIINIVTNYGYVCRELPE
jgi:hypothetical protein